MEEQAEKQHDVLDDIKLAEKHMKMALLVKNLKSLKETAKEVLIQKEKMIRYLEAMGMTDTEQKRVIDFINSLVTLTRKDKEEIQDFVDVEMRQSKEKVEKKLDEDPFKSLGLTSQLSYTTPHCAALAYQAMPTANVNWSTAGSMEIADYNIMANGTSLYLTSSDGTKNLLQL